MAEPDDAVNAGGQLVDPPRRGFLSRWTTRFARCLAVVILAGIVVRWTIKDRFLASSILFYATPLPLLLVGTTTCLAMAFVQKRRFATRFWFFGFLVLMTCWIRQDWKFNEKQQPATISTAKDVSVLFWNVARRQDLSAAAQYIRERDPDVVGLVEVQGDVKHWKTFWQEQLPQYDVTALGGNMYLLAKGTSGDTFVHELGAGSSGRQLRVHLRDQDYDFLLVDILANPFESRRPALTKLAEEADALAGQQLVIMGDFNTPADSVHLESLRKNHQLSFEAAGVGYAPTWPIPLPLMQLDQIWTSRSLIPIHCRHSWTWASDHQPVEAIICPAH